MLSDAYLILHFPNLQLGSVSEGTLWSGSRPVEENKRGGGRVEEDKKKEKKEDELMFNKLSLKFAAA